MVQCSLGFQTSSCLAIETRKNVFYFKIAGLFKHCYCLIQYSATYRLNLELKDGKVVNKSPISRITFLK